MKNFRRTFFLSIIITIANIPTFGQPSIPYFKALEYIKHQNAGKKLVVSDTIIHLSFANFSEQISTAWGKTNNNTFDILDSVDHAREKQKFILNEFKGLKVAGKRPAEIIYFSDFYDFMVIGEVIELNEEHGLSHDAQTGLNESTQYLFVFDKKYTLKRVFKATIAYD